MKKTLIVLLTLFSFMACHPQDKSFEGDNKVSFASYNKLPIVEGKINNRKAFFILDSGASISVLDENQANKYDFDVLDSPGNEAAGYGGVAQFSNAFNANVELGGVQFTSNYRAQDLTAIVSIMEAQEGIIIAGIIGNDVMKPNKFIINFADNTISLGK